MEQSFYADKLAEHGVEAIIPEEAARGEIHRIIFEELCAGQILEPSRQFMCEVIADLKSRGASAIALACTEIMLLIEQSHSSLPLLDTTALHGRAAVDFALSA